MLVIKTETSIYSTHEDLSEVRINLEYLKEKYPHEEFEIAKYYDNMLSDN